MKIDLYFVTIKQKKGRRYPKTKTKTIKIRYNYQNVSTLIINFIGNLRDLVDFVVYDKKQEKENERLKKELKISKKAKNKNINPSLSQSRLMGHNGVDNNIIIMVNIKY